MQYDEFVGAVAARARCEPHRAEAASKAVVRALAEQVSVDTFMRAAAQLPGPLKDELPPASSPHLMELREFYGRVTELGGVESVHDPEAPVRAVLATLYDALPDGAMDEVAADLPRAYGDLLPEGAGPVGADAFLARVEQYAELASRDEAAEVTETTLHTLAERISTGQAQDLAAALPAPLRPYLEAPGEAAADFDVRVFIRQVMDVRHLDAASAERQVRAVLTVLRESVPEHEFNDTLAQLPRDAAGLFR